MAAEPPSTSIEAEYDASTSTPFSAYVSASTNIPPPL